MVFAMVPLPFLILGFKFYYFKVFDTDYKYYDRANLSDAKALRGVGKLSKKATERPNSKFGG
ncbi:hypothetical protein N7510_011571 [Penicillium lagena]|uniref:uncharacterized protein n=1 Tax=Penicillium lagena TaxID=94218 RepID=UPI002541384E|nr:uncharacterized protein N7510_011571 [Penicillium lagena]KAJ5602037.1 hypothetical protein N7510_011571 [Penicillium lagena]